MILYYSHDVSTFDTFPISGFSFCKVSLIMYSQGNATMFNKLCLYEKGHVTEPEMYSLWLKISISYNYCRYSFVIASVGFIIDRVATQHTPKCVENCYDNKVSYNCLPNVYQFLYKLCYNSENSVYSQRRLIILLRA